MKILIAATIYLGAFMLLTACGAESGNLVIEKPLPVEEPVVVAQYDRPAEQKFLWVKEDGGQSQLDFNPQVDILFVIDNSDSMRATQGNLVRNINRFSEGITKNRMIDYHIGVISTWDSSERFATQKKDSYGIGELRYIKDSQGKSYNKRYISRKEQQILASTLNIGVVPFSQGGPENEEFFSPILAALEKSGRGGVNEGFFRPEAQLVVVILTDADESQPRYTAEQMTEFLAEFKGRRSSKVSIYGALIRAEDPETKKDWALRIHPNYHPECFDMTQKKPVDRKTCSPFGPEVLEELVLKANQGSPDFIRANNLMAITSKDFGKDLARIGNDIKMKTLAKEILLSYRPRAVNGKSQIAVRYGTEAQLASGKAQVIPEDIISGWVYDPVNNSILLSGSIEYQYQEGARFEVQLIPVTLKGSGN